MKQFRFAFPLVVLCGLVGCGDGVSVEGTVTLDGQPLTEGTITFEPEQGSGTTGPGATTSIKDGEFEISGNEYLVPGRYVVRIEPGEVLTETRQNRTPWFRPWETKVVLDHDMDPLSWNVPAVRPRPTRRTRR